MEVLVEKPDLDFEEDKKEAKKDDDDEDVLLELAKNVVIGRKLPPGCSFSKGQLAYNEEQDEITELKSDSDEE